MERGKRTGSPRIFACEAPSALDSGDDHTPKSIHQEDISRFLLAEGRFLTSLPLLLDELCGRLDALGLELARVNLEVRTLHPEVGIELVIWGPPGKPPYIGPSPQVKPVETVALTHGKVLRVALAHGARAGAPYLTSPLFPIIEKGQDEVRCRVAAEPEPGEYPVLGDLRASGCTDYFAVGLAFLDGARSPLTFATRKPGGFTERDLDRIRKLVPAMSLCVDTHASRAVTRTLLRTYLGAEPGERVLAGRIRRGDVERIDAAIWFSDLRGFTERSAAVGPLALVEWLNAYFGTIAQPIEAEGGEILKFVGDAVLAVFPVTGHRTPHMACDSALRAARAANRRLGELEATRRESFAHGIALHIGEVQYGNIGAERRLDFTVIGPAVNLASRVEGLCSRLGCRTLATEAVQQLVAEPLADAGTFELKGVPGQHRIFKVE